jgi:acyl carrier protein
LITDRSAIRARIKAYIIETFMDGEGSFGDDDQLFETGIIDSIGFIKLLSFIESTFHVSIDMGEFTIDSGTVNGIEDLISSRMK